MYHSPLDYACSWCHELKDGMSQAPTFDKAICGGAAVCPDCAKALRHARAVRKGHERRHRRR